MDDSPPVPRITQPYSEGLTAGWEWPGKNPTATLVFAHATGFNASAYRTLLDLLPESIRIIAINQRGHGTTRLPADPEQLLSWQVYGDDLVDTLKRANLGPVHFAGHSMGAMAGVLAAAAYPDLFRTLTLFDPVLDERRWYFAMRTPLGIVIRRRMSLAKTAQKRRASWPDRQTVIDAYRGRGIFGEMPEQALLDYLEDGLTQSPDGVFLSCDPAWEAATFRARAYHPWRALRRLGRQSVPLRVVLAERGSTLTAARSAVHTVIPQAGFHIMAGCGHFAPLQQPHVACEHLKASIFSA